MGSAWKIPPFTIDLLAKGDAILFLGSGASFECRTSEGKRALMADGLRDSLCDVFLGGEGKRKSLQTVGDLAKSSAGILDMQRHVGRLYEPLLPTKAHLEIPRYRWKAIVTTNYDLAVERAYEGRKDARQSVAPIISDDDDFPAALSDPNVVPLLKLHGCVTRVNDTQLPLILSSSEYARYRTRRTRLFNYLKDWCFDYPIVFCGYSIADENVRDILFDVFDQSVSHKRFVLWNPDVIQAEVALWGERKVDAVPGTFDQLMEYLATEISDAKLALAGLETRTFGALSKHIAGRAAPTDHLLGYLSSHLDHIHADLANQQVKAQDFYRGRSEGFSWLQHELDIERSATEELLLDLVVSERKIDLPELHVIRGYAGSGKTVALKRFAWELAVTYGKPTFFLKEGGELLFEHVHELYQLVNEPIFVLIDSVLELQEQVDNFLRQARKLKVPIIVVCTARTNEWNVDAAELSPHLTAAYDILDLTEAEVGSLLLKLHKSNCLGYMSSFSLEEQVRYLKSKLQNQLLVALHEATSGRSFSEIVADEYVKLVPSEAQRLYLDICTVHRVGVPVRAGTISRVSGIRMEDFHQKLFKPLEHVVQTQFWGSIGDYVYKSRHPNIAQLVFEAAVPDEEERSAQLVRIIQSLNTGYSTDNQAVTHLIRAKQLAKDFSDKQLAYAVFRAARDAGVSDEVVDQHIAQFELLHKSGDLPKARHLIDQAIEGSRNGKPTKSTLHVKAQILRRQARESGSALERDRRRQEARSILDRLISDRKDPHQFVLKADILIDELEERLDDSSDVSSKLVGELLKDIQLVFLQCRQNFPRDAYVSTVESRLASTMNEHPKATAILERAHKADKHTSFLAIRLAERYMSEGRGSDAFRILSETLKAAGPSKEIHLAMAECLRAQSEEDHAKEIIDHLRRSFSDGDNRYSAQFLYARQQFLFGDRAKADAIFRVLERAKVPPRSIDAASEPIKAGGIVKKFTGMLGVVRPSYAFVRSVELGRDLYVAKRYFNGDWNSLTRGAAISFSVAFSFRGPVATNAQPIE